MVNKKAEEQGGEEGASQPPLSMQRSRWATRKLTVKSSSLKRISLVGRRHNRNASTEKKRTSGGSESLRQPQDHDHDHEQTGDLGGNADNASISSDESGSLPRTIFFNLPLPKEFKDDEGRPLQQYTRNKIRTAKYTPLSFIPKNLWFQFHNIANIFFLFVVILVVSVTCQPLPTSCYRPKVL